MIKKVKTQIDFIALEHQILEFWEKNQIFKKRVKANAGHTKWSFIDGPITANNPMGVHHAWGRTLKDLYNRYKSMQGFELRYQNGFDCQGLWVEIEVEKELGFNSKKDVEEYGIEKFVDLCKQRVNKYSKIQTKQSQRLGYWMDWDNSYFTMSDENNYTIWHFLKKLFESGKIYRGHDVVPWSGRSGTSYSQMEIIEGRKLVTHKSVFVRFPLIEKPGEYLLVWTTTPWTLSSNVVAGVNVDLDYLKLKAGDGIYYVAQENLKYKRLEKQFIDKKQWIEGVPKLKTISQLFKERGGYEILGKVKGAQMLGWKYKSPYDDFKAHSIPGGYPFNDQELEKRGVTALSQHAVVNPGKDGIGQDIVVAGEGTGIVHMAPGCGDIDHKVGKKLQLVQLSPLDDEAKFIDNFGWLKGQKATDKQTTDSILKDLKDRGFLFHVEDYPHIYPHCWRSGDELVFRLVDEWYINMDWRSKINKIVDQINWIPEWGADREHEWLENMGDWMISKKRFWGLALPIWTFEDGSFHVVGSKNELKELAIEGWDEFEGKSPHRPWIDKVKIRHPESGLIGTRVVDVGNPWLDAGIVPFSTLKYNQDRKYWKEWFPADFVTESFPGQFRNWFYSLLAMSALLEEKPPFKNLLGHALVKDENGMDMHKSAGNAIWFEDAAEKMGVDVMRWMFTAHNPEHNLLFGYHVGDRVRKKIIQLWNSYAFFATYAAVDGFDPTAHDLIKQDLTIMDRWILSKLNNFVKNSRQDLDNFKADLMMNKFDVFLDELSNWYIRRSRRRFWKTEDDSDKQAAHCTLYTVLTTTIKILAPVLPFITEEMYGNLIKGTDPSQPESIHLCDFPEVSKNLIDDKLMIEIDKLRKLVELGRSARNKSNLKIRQPLAELCFVIEDDEIADFIIKQKSVIVDELNVKSLKRLQNSEELLTYEVKANLPVLGRKYGQYLPAIRLELGKMDGNSILKSLQSKKILALNIQNESILLTREDLLINTLSVPGFTSSAYGNMSVGITTEITEILRFEGLVRDLIRQVQIMRKNANFAVEDRIIIYGNLQGDLEAAVKQFEDLLKNETLAIEFIKEFKKGEFEADIDINNQNISLSISRAK